MTEQDALQKWCPFVRVPAYKTSTNRTATGDADESFRCLGSQCMAWRGYSSEGKEQGYCGMVGRNHE